MAGFSTLITDYFGYGLFSARPATPDIEAGCMALYYATDTATLSVWDGGWVVLTTTALPAGITSVFAGSLTAAGTNQGTAFAAVSTTNIFTAVASGTGTRLVPGVSGAVGALQTIINAGANTLNVYPDGTDQIEAFGAGVAALVAPGGKTDFRLNSTGQWYAR